MLVYSVGGFHHLRPPTSHGDDPCPFSTLTGLFVFKDSRLRRSRLYETDYSAEAFQLKPQRSQSWPPDNMNSVNTDMLQTQVMFGRLYESQVSLVFAAKLPRSYPRDISGLSAVNSP